MRPGGANSKGKSAEREIAAICNVVANRVLLQLKMPMLSSKHEYFKRNLNQSAFGGADIENPFGLQIEVKHQKQLAINKWWEQVLEASNEYGGFPILAYKNKGKWFFKMYVHIPISNLSYVSVDGTIGQEQFETWLHELIKQDPTLLQKI